MQFYYDDKMPLRILDEGEFWKRQESEHTDVIRALVPDLESPFVDALQAWKNAFEETHAAFVRYIELVVRSGHRISSDSWRQIMGLVDFAMKQSKQFIVLLNQMATDSEAMKKNPTALTVLHHIRRESEYFIGIAQALLSNQ